MVVKTIREQIAERIAELPAADDWLARNNAERAAERKLRRDIIATLPPKGSRPHCRQCGEELPVFRFYGHETLDPDRERRFGGHGDNLFCGLNCGYRYGVRTAK